MRSVGLLGFFLLIFFLTGFFFLYFFLLVKCFLLLSVLPRQLVKCPVPFRSFSSTVHSASKISSDWTPVGLMKLEWSQIVGFVLMRRFFLFFFFFLQVTMFTLRAPPQESRGTKPGWSALLSWQPTLATAPWVPLLMYPPLCLCLTFHHSGMQIQKLKSLLQGIHSYKKSSLLSLE